MHKNFAVACLALALGAAVADAQTPDSYEAPDENEAPADQRDQQEAPQEVQAPAPAKRAVPRVFRGTRPGGVPGEPDVEQSASESEAAISDDGQSLGGVGFSIGRAPNGKITPERSRRPADNAGGAGGGASGAANDTTGASAPSHTKGGRKDLPDLVYRGLYVNAFLRQVGDRSLNFGESIALGAGSVCHIVSGQLPPGLAWDSANCKIRGIPTAAGVYNIIWKVQNQFGGDTANLTMEITNPARISILTARLPSAKVGVPYNELIIFYANPGVVGKYQSGVRGALPPGLSYVYAEGARSLTASIVGRPTKAGSYQLPVYVAAGGNTNIGESKIFPLTVQP